MQNHLLLIFLQVQRTSSVAVVMMMLSLTKLEMCTYVYLRRILPAILCMGRKTCAAKNMANTLTGVFVASLLCMQKCFSKYNG
jgi:hypothetical protein